ncbi:ankyrin repeat-containing domain protein [Aspergillus varians]
MDSDSLTGPTERRRLQNRIAQRRFRREWCSNIHPLRYTSGDTLMLKFVWNAEKRQLKRGADGAPNRQADRPAAHLKSNCDNATPTDRPLDFALPNMFSLETESTNPHVETVAFDLETIDNLLHDYNSTDPPLDAHLFSSFLAPTSSIQSSCSGSSTSPDAAFRNLPLDSQLHPLHNAPNTIPPAPAAVYQPFKTSKDEGWLSTMHIAAYKGHEHILHVLFEQGNMDINSTDSDGRTPLFYAALGGHESVVRLLLNHGSRVSHLDCNRRSVLHWMAQYQKLEVLRTLLEYWSEHERASYDINAYDNYGWTPLHLAVERGFEEGVLLLIQRGADMNAKARKCWMTGRVIPFDLNQLID